MKITICGSMYHVAGILQAKERLEEMGHTVETPDISEKNDYTGLEPTQVANFKEKMIRQHLVKIKDSDAILVYNDAKNDIAGYIGGNTLMEMAFAFALGKPIFLYNSVPDMSYTDEILGMKPIALQGNLEDMR